jgi:hypothetical protein
MDIQSSMFASEDEYSFFLDPDTPIKDAEKNLKHPFVLSIVSVFGEIMTSSDLEKLNYYATLIWNKYYDSDETRQTMNEIPGGEELLHVLINMKDFVQTLKYNNSNMSTSDTVQTTKRPRHN